VYLASNGPVTTHGIVTIVNDRSFDVFLPEVGLTGRIYIDVCFKPLFSYRI
jgi:exoribonuclease R